MKDTSKFCFETSRWALVCFFAALFLVVGTADAQEKSKVPSRNQLTDANKEIKKRYGKELASKDRLVQIKAADRLLLDAKSSKDKHIKFVAFQQAITVYESVGDLKASLAALREQHRLFETNLASLCNSSIRSCKEKASSKDQVVKNLVVLDYHSRIAMKSGDFPLAKMILKQIPGELFKLELKSLPVRSKLFDEFKKHLPKSDLNRNNYKSNEAVGQWLFFGVGECDRAIPYLAMGTDKKTVPIAVAEIKSSQTKPFDGYSVALQWIDYAGDSQSLQSRMARQRAQKLLSKSLPALKDSAKLHAEQILDQMLLANGVDEKWVKGEFNSSLRMHGNIINRFYNVTWSDSDPTGAFEQLILYPDGKCYYFVGHNFFPLRWSLLPNEFKLSRTDYIYSFQSGKNDQLLVRRINPKTSKRLNRTASALKF